MRTIALLTFVSLWSAGMTGCSFLTQNIPSLQYCDKVEYVREGTQMNIKAECYVPR